MMTEWTTCTDEQPEEEARARTDELIAAYDRKGGAAAENTERVRDAGRNEMRSPEGGALMAPTVEQLAADARQQKEVLDTLKRAGAPCDVLRRTADEYTRLYVRWHVAKYGKAPTRVPKIRMG